MKTITIQLQDHIHQVLRIRAVLHNCSPEKEAQSILCGVCGKDADGMANLKSKIESNNPSDIASPGIAVSVDDSPSLPIINRLQDIIDNESGVAVFTRDLIWNDSFSLDPDNHNGYTGDWRMNPYGLEGKTVVIYNAQPTNVGRNNVIYKARITKIVECPNDRGRYKIHFEACEKKGITYEIWKKFADTGSNPVKYFYQSRPI